MTTSNKIETQVYEQSAQPAKAGGAARKSHNHAKRISFGFTACSLHNAKCIM
jgi:hypothetical protein